MKRILTLSSLLAITTSGLHGLVNLGEGQIEFSAETSLTYDSRITARNTELEDTILIFSPSLVYSRPMKQADLSASVGIRFYEYFDNSEFSEDNFFFDFSVSPKKEIQTSRIQVVGDITINTTTRSNEDTGTIVTTRNYGAGGTLTYDPNRNYTLIVDASVSREDPEDSDLREIDRYGGGIRLQVPIKQNIMGNVGVRYEDIDSDEELQSAGEVFTILGGFSGLLLPKVEGSLLGGINQRENDLTGDEESPYLSASLLWAYDDLTQVSLSASSTVNSTVNDLATETVGLNLSVTRSLSRELSVTGTLGYSDIKYTSPDVADRNDEQAFISFSVSHGVGRWGRLSANIQYTERTSDTSVFDYDRFRAGLTLSSRW